MGRMLVVKLVKSTPDEENVGCELGIRVLWYMRANLQDSRRKRVKSKHNRNLTFVFMEL